MANLTLIEAMAKTAELVYKKVKTLLVNKVDKDGSKVLSTNDYTTTEKQKLAGIEEGAEVNKNAFSNVKVGGKTISADTVTDTLELIAGKNITLTPNVDEDTVDISAVMEYGHVPFGITSGTNAAYTLTASGYDVGKTNFILAKIHAANAANATLKVDGQSQAFPINYNGASLTANQLPANSIVGLAFVSLDERPRWEVIYSVDTNTTYNAVTTSANGLMTKEDKVKLNAFKSASEYALKSDITGVYTYKGSVATYAELPLTHANGDVWDVKSDGKNYAWNGTEWDDLGGVIIIDETTLISEINTVLAD